jgi:hypothetical protein
MRRLLFEASALCIALPLLLQASALGIDDVPQSLRQAVAEPLNIAMRIDVLDDLLNPRLGCHGKNRLRASVPFSGTLFVHPRASDVPVKMGFGHPCRFRAFSSCIRVHRMSR